MQTKIIPENQWIEFCDRFTRDHLGWRTTIEVLQTESGPLRIAQNLPLQGLSFDTKGSRPATLEVSVGDRPGSHLSHFINLPLHIREAEAEGTVELQIEPASGPVTLVHVTGPVH